jgi:hypothetical protein
VPNTVLLGIATFNWPWNIFVHSNSYGYFSIFLLRFGYLFKLKLNMHHLPCRLVILHFAHRVYLWVSFSFRNKQPCFPKQQDCKGAVSTCIRKVPTRVLWKFWMFVAEIKNTISNINYASFTVSIGHISVATGCRRCRNILVPLPHKIYSSTRIYLHLIHKGNQRIAI